MGNTVRVNGIRLAWEERGSGPPLVLVMGLGADRSAWEQHARAWERQFRCILVDNRGAGQSDHPAGPYSTAQMADDYAGLVTTLGLVAVQVVGISMGGAIAQQLALRHPQMVRAMVLVSTWACCDSYTASVFRHFATMRGLANAADFTQLLQLWIWGPESTERMTDELRAAREDALRAAAEGRWMTQSAFEAQCEACIHHDTTSELRNIHIPVLLTAGSDDIFTPTRFAHYLCQNLEDSKLELFPHCAHVHHWEALEEFNSFTMRWLVGHASAEAAGGGR
jgi:pimeloyl-ACP methyl ester carboxylesterase